MCGAKRATRNHILPNGREYVEFIPTIYPMLDVGNPMDLFAEHLRRSMRLPLIEPFYLHPSLQLLVCMKCYALIFLPLCHSLWNSLSVFLCLPLPQSLTVFLFPSPSLPPPSPFLHYNLTWLVYISLIAILYPHHFKLK